MISFVNCVSLQIIIINMSFGNTIKNFPRFRFVYVGCKDLQYGLDIFIVMNTPGSLNDNRN